MSNVTFFGKCYIYGGECCIFKEWRLHFCNVTLAMVFMTQLKP